MKFLLDDGRTISFKDLTERSLGTGWFVQNKGGVSEHLIVIDITSTEVRARLDKTKDAKIIASVDMVFTQNKL